VRRHATILALVALAFVLRVAVRLALTAPDAVDEGYTFYLGIARTFVDGGGLCGAPGEGCTQRVPVYPLFLAPFVATGWLYPGLAIAQAMLGAATVWLVWRLARHLFGPRAALVAGALAALNPYAVVHDTALQDTSLVNLLIVASVYLLARSVRLQADPHEVRLKPDPTYDPTYVATDVTTFVAVAAGLALALAVLTTARVALMVPAALAWTALATPGPWRARARRAALVTIPVVLLVGGWVGRNWRIEGAPVLTTESGVSLWIANHDRTFAFFPRYSMDITAAETFATITPEQHAAITDTIGRPVARDRLLRGWARESIAADPAAVMWNGLRKVWVVASATLTPAHGGLAQAGYLALFLPVHLLAVWGLWRFRATDSAHLLSAAVLAAFVVTTAVFWAHTSHKSVVDSLLFVYAGGALAGLLGWRDA
jgi:4-amino-4-deoxy-L-arabinose transferase-like glycosyltransferase